MTEDIYRHKNGLKHINILNNDGFSALFVVNTPIFDNSGVAHAVEHMVFRRSTAFPKPETLFQLTSLTDAKINASTFADTTYFHCQSQCSHTFMLAIDYLLNGLFNPIFDAEDLHCELHDGNDGGVIYQELIGVEQANQESVESTEKNNENTNQNDFFYGGTSATIGELSLNDLTTFHQRLYQATNITLVTANADIEQISNLITLLAKQANQSKQTKVALGKGRKQSQNTLQDNVQENVQENAQGNESNAHHQKKYSPAINTLITRYHLWLQDPNYQEIDDYCEIQSTNTSFKTNTESLPTLSSSNLISPLVTLSNTLIKDANNDQAIHVGIKNISIKKLANKTLLPNLFTKLYQQAKKQLTLNEPINELKFQRNQVCVNDQRNALWLTNISTTEQILATITSYIISAYPIFLAPRCQGLCYATQALTIENSSYLVIYSAFDVKPDTRLKAIPLCLLTLSQDKHFISISLALAKIKYCQAYHIDNSQLINITSTAISAYLQVLANHPHPKV